jgi:hypothetical protein
VKLEGGEELEADFVIGADGKITYLISHFYLQVLFIGVF